jgi:dUTP pyrophosphatase
VNEALSELEIQVLRLDPSAPLPSYSHPGDAGADLVTTVAAVLGPGERAVLPTGLAMAIPYGYAAFVHPRSGLAASLGVSLVNSPGTIDAGYRGEVKVIVVNLDPREPVRFSAGDRIAQLVVQRVEYVRFVEADELPDSVRGTGGHGSTGGFTRSAAPPTGTSEGA